MSSKTIKILLVGSVFLASASSAFANGPYIGVAGGASIFHDSDIQIVGLPTVTASYDSGLGVNVSIGSSFDSGRIEGEFGYKKTDLTKLSGPGGSSNISGTDATVKSFMINGYFDIKSESAVTPYIGGGVGILNYELNDNGYKSDDSTMGYQLIAGVGFKLNDNVTLDLSYRFQGAASDFESDGDKISYMSSNVYGGLRFNF